ncbi:MAG: hypothetical protein RIN56_03535 [Sporomusaceae bacterium]|nr:hypothetical protein [Sporomusaceae bacterium]
MTLHLRRPFLALLTALLILAVAAPAFAAERSWVKVAYDSSAPQQLRDNVEASLDTVADLLAEYRIYLTRPITVIVSADHEDYVRILVSNGYTREKAEQTAKQSAGVSLGQRPVIILKGSDALKRDRQEVYRVLPHEIFHQVQSQWGKLGTVNWMVEAAPELFRMKASEKAGFAPAGVFLAMEQLRVKHAKVIPSAAELASKNYAVFSGLSGKGYPVYAMSTLMLNKLVADAGFDKVVYFYQQLHHGADPDKAFLNTFRVPMGWFTRDMDAYFSSLRQ